MPTKNLTIVYVFGACMALLFLILQVLGRFDYEFFYVLGFIIFLLLLQLLGPTTVTPRWKKRADIVIILGLIIFSVIIFDKVYLIITA